MFWNGGEGWCAAKLGDLDELQRRCQRRRCVWGGGVEWRLALETGPEERWIEVAVEPAPGDEGSGWGLAEWVGRGVWWCGEKGAVERDTVAAAAGEGGEADGIAGELVWGVGFVDGLEPECVGAEDGTGARVAVGGFISAHSVNDLLFDPGAVLAEVFWEAVEPGEGANGEGVLKGLKRGAGDGAEVVLFVEDRCGALIHAGDELLLLLEAHGARREWLDSAAAEVGVGEV